MNANCYEFRKLKKEAENKNKLAKSIEEFGSIDYSEWNW